MLDALEKLLILQEQDLTIERLSEELEQIPVQREALEGNTTKSKAALDAAKKKVLEIEAHRKELELEAKGLQERIDKYSNQQLQTKKNEEYQALTNEIANCRKQIVALEDKQIVCMEQTEAAQRKVEEAQKVTDGARKDMEGLAGELNRRETELTAEVEKLEEGRVALAGAVTDDNALRSYERLCDNKGGRVVVGIEHGNCGGCHMTLPKQIAVMVRGNQEVVPCPLCARILYFTNDMDMAHLE